MNPKFYISAQLNLLKNTLRSQGY